VEADSNGISEEERDQAIHSSSPFSFFSLEFPCSARKVFEFLRGLISKGKPAPLADSPRK